MRLRLLKLGVRSGVVTWRHIVLDVVILGVKAGLTPFPQRIHVVTQINAKLPPSLDWLHITGQEWTFDEQFC